MNLQEQFMLEALNEAEKALQLGEIPIGAVIVKDNQIIGRSFNQCERLHDATAHAEHLAIRMASVALGNWRLDGCSLYVTLEPCMMCMGAVINARIPRLYFGAYNKQFDQCRNFSLADTAQSYHIDIFPSILNQECKQILDTFFSKKRLF